MRRLATVMVATDFSEHADKAVHRAARLAAEHSARLVLLHVVETAAWRRWFATAPNGTSSAARRLDELARNIRRRTRIEVLARLEHGVPSDTIARAARQADMLVLGATNGGSLRERVLETTAHRLLLPFPLLSDESLKFAEAIGITGLASRPMVGPGNNTGSTEMDRLMAENADLKRRLDELS